MNNSKETKSKKDRALLLVIGLLLVVIAGLILVLLLPREGDQISIPGYRDPNASIGQLEGKSVEEIQAELNRIVEEGMFNISINPNIYFENGEAEGEVRIENSPANHYLMKVEITLDDSGEVVYTSGLIEPNYHIQTAKLAIPLEEGSYEATAVFTAFDPANESKVGQAAAKIKLHILG